MSWIPKLVINAGLSEQIGSYAFSLFNMGAHGDFPVRDTGNPISSVGKER